MINRVIAILFIVLGGMFVLQGILPVRTRIPDSVLRLDSATMPKIDPSIVDNMDSAEQQRAHAIVIQELKEHWIRSQKANRKTSLIVMLIGFPLALGGFAFYKRSKKMSLLPENLSITPLVQKQNKSLIWSVAVFALLLVMLRYLARNFEAPLLLFLMLICFLGIIYFVRELIFFNDNFGNVNRHLVSWVYPNGDCVVITCWGLLKYNQIVPDLSVSFKFEGVRWELDNAKDLAESLLKGEGNPLLALVPSVEFSTTSNRVEDYIPFSFADKVDMTFVDKGHGYLIVRIEKKYYNKKYTLSFPVPESKASLATEVEIFDQRIAGRHTPVRALYIDKSVIEGITGEDTKPPNRE
jgi:hypothetical protein